MNLAINFLDNPQSPLYSGQDEKDSRPSALDTGSDYKNSIMSINSQERPAEASSSSKSELNAPNPAKAVAMLFVEGYPPHHIAQALGMDVGIVNSMLAGPKVQFEIRKLIEERGPGALDKMLRAASLDGFFVARTMLNFAVSENVRASVAKDLMDRYFGKPLQRIKQDDDASNPFEEAKKVEAEIKQLLKELKNEPEI